MHGKQSQHQLTGRYGRLSVCSMYFLLIDIDITAFIAICRTLNVVDFVVDVIHEIKYIFKKSYINLYYIDTRGASLWNKSLLFRMIKLGTNLRVTWRSSSPIHELRKIAIHVRGEGALHFVKI